MTDEIDNLYGSVIQKSRYARWLDDQGRRETWRETVDRYVYNMKRRNDDLYPGSIDSATWEEIREAIFDLDVMPSMRGLMTAGPALDREPLAIFNCSFIAADSPRAFDEALYILMNGVGLGVSVESKYVTQLPDVPVSIAPGKGETVVVEDSKEGWATAQRELIDHLYNGVVPAIDVTRVRPAGARLMTFGGRASGPQPLVDLFDFTINVFKRSVGRKLSTTEVADIFCKTGEVVVVGGVRRSALIITSDLNDYDMSKFKSGSWWVHNPHRALANISATYETKPSIGAYLQEMGALYESKSGERGIFNLEQARKGASSPRRDASLIRGTNPCGEILLRSAGLCNLTEVIVKESDDAESLANKVRIASILGTVQSTFTNFGYLRPIWQENAEEERLLGVSMTGQFGNELMSGKKGKRELRRTLTELKNIAISTNADLAREMGINQSVAVTTVKPSGTVSQLTHSSAGMHAWHSEYYLRTIRADNKDPLTMFLKDAGVPHEPEVNKPDHTTVFTFPVKAPEGAITRNDLTAIEHLEIWKAYKQCWTEHNPSVTITVLEDEWIEVFNWVYHNWDSVGGLSFLPHTDHVYQQAPYQECDETTYRQFMADMPKEINWDLFGLYESEDNTTGAQTLSCTSSACELVDVGA